jgi:hypothetical protein
MNIVIEAMIANFLRAAASMRGRGTARWAGSSMRREPALLD